MAKPRDQLFETITTEGALLPSDFLQRLAQHDRDIAGLTPDAYHLGSGEKINEAISRSWNRLLAAWKNFAAAAQALPANDVGTTLTREKWLLPLFQELGYGRLQTAKAFEFEDRRYAISHGWGAAPIHLVSFRADLDERSEAIVGARKSTPHSMVQEFLNRSDAHLWGMVSNGYRLRLLRDNASLTRQAFVDFDLQSMMQGEVYADFALLWLLLHQSRVECERPELCWLEKWTQEARQQGERFLDHMRDGVESAIETLGQGFLAHPANTALRQLLRDGQLPALDYYKQLLRVVYRFIFLFIAEDRDLLHAPVPDNATETEKKAAAKAKEAYFRHYSVTRLRRMAQRVGGTLHADLWQIVRLVVGSLGAKEGCPALGLPALGSFLWSPRATPSLNDCHISNRYLLQTIRSLAITQQGRFRRPVDYKNIGSAEFGSVYESLLEQHPKLNLDAATFTLDTHAGNERKTTGSHFTPPPLVNCLLDSALEPVLKERERDFVKLGFKSAEEAILSIKVCDKAVGSGHFLIGAAHRIAKRLASVRTGEAEPSPAALRHALRDVIGRCLYGVDINPMAVELCKFALWLEALEPGKPLSFLDHHIQCGNSLLGATPALMAQGIPDAAFEPIEGDDKKYCSQFKKANREESTQLQLLTASDKPWEHLGNLATSIAQLANLPDDRLEDVQVKEQKYAELVHSTGYEFGRQLADAWCAAFVLRKAPPAIGGFDYPITNEVFRRLERNPHDAPNWMRDEIKRLAEQYQFFHWHLAFPNVFQVPPAGQKAENKLCGWNGGFDVILGNPPWDRPKPEPSKYFAAIRPDIADAQTSARRDELLAQLETTDPRIFRAWKEYERGVLGQVAILTQSGQYPLSAVGKFNLGNVFVERARTLLSFAGRIGLLNVSGLATDDSGKLLISALMRSQTLESLYDFENREGLFTGVHRSYKFSAITILGEATKTSQADFVFFALNVSELSDSNRHVSYSAEDIALLNPISENCPVFRERKQAEVVKAIYRTAQLRRPPAEVLWDWDCEPTFLFVMSDHSDLFATREELRLSAFRSGDIAPLIDDERYLPLYESKMFHQFDHRWARLTTYGEQNDFELSDHCDPDCVGVPRYWMRERDATNKLSGIQHSWLVAVREVTNATNERTCIAAILPKYPVGHNAQVFVFKQTASDAASFTANLNAHAFDFATRTKVGGSHLSSFILRQLPLLAARKFSETCLWSAPKQPLRGWLLPRVLELTYTAWDLEPFAQDCGWNGPPFRWDEARRFLLRCELDAAFFHLYGINRDDTQYIMETFPIVKRKDEAAHGTYRTKFTILKIYDALAEAQRTGKPYQTLLSPPPASIQVAHPPRFDSERVNLDVGDYILSFVFSLLRYSGGACDIMRLVRGYALLQQPQVFGSLVEAQFDEAGRKWVEKSAQQHDAKWFLPILRRMETQDMVLFEVRGDDVIVHQQDTQGPRVQAAVGTDAFLVARVLDFVPDTAIAEPVKRIMPKVPRVSLEEATIPS